MAARGSVYKRCFCRDPQTGRQVGARCRKLSQRGHGRWYLQFRDPRTGEQLRRGGFDTQAEATAALDALRADAAAPRRPGQPQPTPMSTGEWLEHWLRQKSSATSVSTVGRQLASTTARSYRGHLDNYLLPVIGRIPLAELTADDLRAVFDRVDKLNRDTSRPMGPASIKRLYATVRSALNAAVKQQKIPDNPSRFLTLRSAPRPKGLIWTEGRINEWRRTGRRPSPVMVWTPEQTARFLAHATSDPLYALYHVIALRGLRRGEAVALQWSSIDLSSGTLIVCEQLVQIGWTIERSKPKANSEREVALDQWTLQVLRLHHQHQTLQLAPLGTTPFEVGWVFTHNDGSPFHPNYVTRHFHELAEAAGLPPIRLHDLRHGAATLALASGTEMKVVQEMLGHSTIALTADTYTSVLPQVAHAAAEAIAALLRASGGSPPQLTGGGAEPAASPPSVQTEPDLDERSD
jgi:integrase